MFYLGICFFTCNEICQYQFCLTPISICSTTSATSSSDNRKPVEFHHCGGGPLNPNRIPISAVNYINPKDEKVVNPSGEGCGIDEGFRNGRSGRSSAFGILVGRGRGTATGRGGNYRRSGWRRLVVARIFCYLQATVQCQFFQNVVHMALDCVCRNVKPLGDFLIA